MVKIEEQDEQHMVIGGSVGGGCSLIFGLVFFIVWVICVQLIPIILIRVLFSLVGFVGILFTLRALMGTRIVIDKPTQTIAVRNRSLFLTNRQRIIPFSDVRGIVIDYEPQGSGSGETGTTWHDAWKVSIGTSSKKFKIDHTTKKVDMLHLASEISSFIEMELIDNSAKRGTFEYLEDLFGRLKRFFRR